MKFRYFYREISVAKDLTTDIKKPIIEKIQPNIQKSQEFLNLSSILPEFSSKKGVLLCNSGSYNSLDINETLMLIASPVIFVLNDENNFKYSFIIYDVKKKQIYKVFPQKSDFYINYNILEISHF